MRRTAPSQASNQVMALGLTSSARSPQRRQHRCKVNKCNACDRAPSPAQGAHPRPCLAGHQLHVARRPVEQVSSIGDQAHAAVRRQSGPGGVGCCGLAIGGAILVEIVALALGVAPACQASHYRRGPPRRSAVTSGATCRLGQRDAASRTARKSARFIVCRRVAQRIRHRPRRGSPSATQIRRRPPIPRAVLRRRFRGACEIQR